MITTLIIYMVWTISCVLAFLGGVAYKTRVNHQRKGVSSQSLPTLDTAKELKELQNFWAYDGTEQQPILDEESF